MPLFNPGGKRPYKDEEANMNQPATAPKLENASKPAGERGRRDLALPTSLLQQLSHLERAIGAETAGHQGLPSVVLDLVGGRVTAKASTVLPSDPSAALGSTARPSGHAFIDAFKNLADNKTNKGGAAYQSSGTALVDLDFALKPPGDPQEIRELLQAAYAEDALATVKIVFRARSIHEGKGFREGFWIAAGWLMEHHPRTLLENLHLLVDPTCERPRSQTRDAARKDPATGEDDNMGVDIVDEAGTVEQNTAELPQYPARPHGTYDDLNDLLMLALNGQLNGTYTGRPISPDEISAPAKVHQGFKQDRKRRKNEPKVKRDRAPFTRLGVEAKKLDKDSFQYKLLKAGTHFAKSELFTQRLFKALKEDKKFQALYLTVVYIYVKQLRADLALLDQHKDFLAKPDAERAPFGPGSSPHLFGMSFAAKWCASPGHSADRQTYIASAIAHLLFSGDGFNIARARLQKTYLSPLREVLRVPETRMTQGEWKINYSQVPGRCMARNASNFMAHDPKGFEAYLMKVAKGKKTIAGASLMPHEIVMDACGSDLVGARVADLQWRSLVESLVSAGTRLDNCIAVADVSGSMGNYLGGDKKHPQPINVCIALTLLLNEVAVDPWRGMFFTFSEQPAAEFVDMALPIRERADKLAKAHWGMTTNFHTVFELILRKAQEEHLQQEQMVKKLFVFSDMQFDAAGGKHHGDTEYAAIRRKFEAAGYVMPELIFWNLHASDKTPMPVKANQEGVSLMSGFSGAQIKYFLRQQGGEEEEWDMADANEAGEDEAMAEGVEGRKAKKDKTRDSPFDTLRKVLAADSLKGVTIYD